MRKTFEKLSKKNVIGDENEALESYNKLQTKLEQHVNLLDRQFEEFMKISEETDLISFSTLYHTYLEVEALSFENLNTNKLGGSRFSTRFANYALAVQRIVQTLNKVDINRYEYYTLLNRYPSQFFNLENHGADSTWSILFLEYFCRRYLNEKNAKVPGYTRYFLVVDEPYRKQDRPEPPSMPAAVKEYNGSKILVLKKSKQPVLWLRNRGREWIESKRDLAELKILKEIIDQVLPIDVYTCLNDFFNENNLTMSDGYILFDEKKIDSMKDMVNKFNEDIRAKVEFVDLKTQIDLYNHPKFSCKYLCFESLNLYKSTFELKDEDMPKDLFAVRDKKANKWLLCIGTLMGHWDPLAVTLLFITPNKELRNLSWNVLKNRLDAFFLDNEEREKIGAKLYNMDGTKVEQG